MVEGSGQTHIQCKWWDGQPITVGLDWTDFNWPMTHDPAWIVTWSDGRQEKFEWLNYLNSNGVPWQAKAHSEHQNTGGDNFIKTTVQIKHEGVDKDGIAGILIADWNNGGWTANIDDIHQAGPHNPTFSLYNRILPNH